MLVVRPTTAVVVRDEVFTSEEELALAGFLAGYSGLTREAYALDLRQYVQWCEERAVTVFGARRADIESFGRQLETRGRARATIARRLCTITCFYRYAEQEGLIATSPAVHVRRPASTTNPTPPALTATRSAPCSSPPVSATQAITRSSRCLRSMACGSPKRPEPTSNASASNAATATLTIVRKGGKIVTIPLAPRTARAVDLAVGERREGPIFPGSNHGHLDRHAASRIVRRVARHAGITKRVGPHTLRHAFITAALDAGVPLRDVQEAASHADPRTTRRYDRARVSLDRHATYIVATFIAGAAR